MSYAYDVDRPLSPPKIQSVRPFASKLALLVPSPDQVLVSALFPIPVTGLNDAIPKLFEYLQV